jgi:hypothetical protein
MKYIPTNLSNKMTTNVISDDIIIHVLAPMLCDKDNFSILTTNKYSYNSIASKIKLKNRYNYTTIDKTTFIPEYIMLDTEEFKKDIITSAKNIYTKRTNSLSSCESLNFIAVFDGNEYDDAMYLPKNTHTLILGHKFKSQIFLPENLKVFKCYVDPDEYHYSFDDLPSTLEILNINDVFIVSQQFPSTLHTLKVGYRYTWLLTHLPINLKKLSVNSIFPIDINFPPNLEELTFAYSDHYNRFANKIPTSLKSLKIKYFCDEKPIKTYPPNLHTLKLGEQFTGSVDHLPSSLHTLEIGYYFNNSVSHLPPNLHTLKFGSCFNQSINHLPKNLHILELGKYFGLSIDTLPSNLKKLYLHQDYKYKKEVESQFKHVKIVYNV